MKLVKLYSFFIVLIFTSVSFAQEFQLGARVESNHFSTSIENVPDPSYYISTFQIIGTMFLNDNLGLDARLGVDRSDFYRGGEVGLLAKYYYKDFYAAGGIVYHHFNGNKSISEHNSSNDYSYSLSVQDLFLPAIGLGYNPGRHFSVELLVQHGLNKKVGDYFDWSLITSSLAHPHQSPFGDINITWITKLGISYSFSL
jgi:hypothetical protein